MTISKTSRTYRFAALFGPAPRTGCELLCALAMNTVLVISTTVAAYWFSVLATLLVIEDLHGIASGPTYGTMSFTIFQAQLVGGLVLGLAALAVAGRAAGRLALRVRPLRALCRRIALD